MHRRAFLASMAAASRGPAALSAEPAKSEPLGETAAQGSTGDTPAEIYRRAHTADARCFGAAPPRTYVPYLTPSKVEALRSHPKRLLHLAEALHRKGYKARSIEKIIGGNYVRVFKEVVE